MKHVQFDKAKLSRLKREYAKAQMENKQSFEFEGDMYLVSRLRNVLD